MGEAPGAHELKAQIPWLRVVVEGVVIVGSILLAFGIECCVDMSRRLRPLIIGVVVLALGWGCDDDPTGLTDPFCSSRPASAIVTFEDANLEAAIRNSLSVGAQDVTCAMMSGLTRLVAQTRGITSLMGIENLTSLTSLLLDDNSITDISAVSGLTSLTTLTLSVNSISDIGPLSGLTSLTVLTLIGNSISDIQPLLDNTGLGAGDVVNLSTTNVNCTDVALLKAKGVLVGSACQ